MWLISTPNPNPKRNPRPNLNCNPNHNLSRIYHRSSVPAPHSRGPPFRRSGLGLGLTIADPWNGGPESDQVSYRHSIALRGLATGVYRCIYPQNQYTLKIVVLLLWPRTASIWYVFTCGTLTYVFEIAMTKSKRIPHQINFLAMPLVALYFAQVAVFTDALELPIGNTPSGRTVLRMTQMVICRTILHVPNPLFIHRIVT